MTRIYCICPFCKDNVPVSHDSEIQVCQKCGMRIALGADAVLPEQV